ncbi:hypothetical protein LW135_04660 [Helicobacter sp. faydin-H20]|uniref:hypothetical protein n=1 Tax=Helicobacter anatolicus TaxID=2905874 RepID=UPI001E3680B4|nr:hypothetical protein [Helicobacter anatolicus]MCE3037117.1 hypothetical protein [Helicobacter anatolicus]
MKILKKYLRKKFGRNWHKVLSDYAFTRRALSYTNLFPCKKSYRYILLGGHGMGMQAVMAYLDKMGAKPREIFAYEMLFPFVFFEDFDGIVIEKASDEKFYHRTLKTLKKKVPVYQIIRDPISIIKSCFNVDLLLQISNINMQEDREKLLIEAIKKFSHLMFYFTSLQNSIKHLATDITYLTQDSINQKNLQNTLNTFANRFNYSPIKIEESVLKGTAFPRAFPYIFEVEGKSFGLFLSGREKRHCEFDMYISKKHLLKHRDWHITKIKDIKIQGYEDYPLYLASLTEKPSNNQDYNHAGGGGTSLRRRKNAANHRRNYVCFKAA